MDIPQVPGSLPLVGHLRQFLTDPTRFLISLPAHGDLVEIRLGNRKTYVPCGPELVAQILLNSGKTFDKGGPFFENIAVFFGDGLATCPNAKHPRLRRLMQPAFRRPEIAAYSEPVGRDVAALLATWRDGQVVDAYRVMQELAMQFTISTMFAAWFTESGAGDDEIAETIKNIDVLVNGAFLRMVAPSLARLPARANRRYDQARIDLYAKIDETITAYRSSETEHHDLLSILLAGDAADDSLSDAELRDQVITMFIAGISTTAATLSWTLHFLSLDPDLEAAVAAEVNEVCAGEVVGHDDLARLPLLDNVVTESFRIRPAAWLFSRVTTAETALGTYTLPSGSPILISPYIIHHRPDLFPDPESFDPGRWGDGRYSLSGPTRAAAMIPFGGGARKCIGYEFAIANVTLTLASILKTWKLTPASGQPVGMSGRSILEPRGLRLRLTRRDA